MKPFDNSDYSPHHPIFPSLPLHPISNFSSFPFFSPTHSPTFISFLSHFFSYFFFPGFIHPTTAFLIFSSPHYYRLSYLPTPTSCGFLLPSLVFFFSHGILFFLPSSILFSLLPHSCSFPPFNSILSLGLSPIYILFLV